MSDIDTRFFIAFLASTIGFAIWFIKRLIDEKRAEAKQRAAQEGLGRALFVEVDFNTTDLGTCETGSPSLESLRAAFADNDNLLPHITFSRSFSDLYRSHIGNLPTLPDDSLVKTFQFYALLDKLHAQVEGVTSPSFRTLSVDGKVAAMDLIRSTARQGRIVGLDLVGELQRQFPHLKLTRFGLGEEDNSSQNLKRRLIRLDKETSNLQGKHDGNLICRAAA